MISVRDQIEHEKKHAELSAVHYYFKQDQLRDKERGDEVDSARSLMRQRIAEVGQQIAKLAASRVGIYGKYNAVLEEIATFDGEVDYDVLAYMGIQVIFQRLSHKKIPSWTSLAQTLGGRIEFEHKTRKFEMLHPGYYFTVMQSLQHQQVQSYDHIRGVLTKKMRDFDMEWNEWSNTIKVQVANKILVSILHVMDDVFFRNIRKNSSNNTEAFIDVTPAAEEWLAEFEAERGFLTPARLPTLIKPRPWALVDGRIDGGYYSYRLHTPMIKVRHKDHADFVAEHCPEEHIAAINKMQEVPWQINRRVLEVQRQMFRENIKHPGIPDRNPYPTPKAPAYLEGLTKEDMTEDQLTAFMEWKGAAKSVHRANKSRQGEIVQFKMSYDLALKYQDYEQFYYVYTADFRGRVYASTPGLSPQGNDTSRALLKFAVGKPAGSTGLYWLAVHGANLYGIDKVSFEDRVDWVYNHHDDFQRIAEDPIGTREFWGAADKPWQFLAFVFDWAGTDYGKNPLGLSYIPVGLDGSCNGLQHYSALLRDPVGGAAVNLTNSELPADIYQQVSDLLQRNLVDLQHTDPMASIWLGARIDRKLAKRPVMTLPYGSTQTSARQYIYDWALDHRENFPGFSDQEIFRACIWLTPHLWYAMKNVVVAASEAMSWIQTRVTKLTKKTHQAITWVSPVGFPVYQPYVERETKRVETRTLSGIRISMNVNEDTDTVCRSKQRSGIAPNFVHSLDSSHMVRVINASDFDGYAMVHDDFGTHACDVGKMWQIIREEFVKMYYNKDLLRDWNIQQGHYDGEYPEMGDLDLMQVMMSEYFFS